MVVEARPPLRSGCVASKMVVLCLVALLILFTDFSARGSRSNGAVACV